MSGRSEGQHVEDLASSDDPVRVTEREPRARDYEHGCQVAGRSSSACEWVSSRRDDAPGSRVPGASCRVDELTPLT